MTLRPQKECVVLIASPSVRIRKRLGKALVGAFSVSQVAARHEMERKMATLKPSVLLVDLALPGLNGIRSLPAIQGLSSSTKILALSGALNHKEEVLALEAGAKGYCHKDLDYVLVKKAVRMIQKGEIWVERGIIPHLIKELADCKRPPRESLSSNPQGLNQLTTRQRDIALLISNGFSNKEIASALNITEATVKAHIHTIFCKLKVSDRLGLALFVIASREKDPSLITKEKASL